MAHPDLPAKCCGNCRFYAPTANVCCFSWPEIVTTHPLPSSMVKRTMKSDEGRNCPCHAPKESSDAPQS